MSEVQEVFRLATQKVRPDPGFEDRLYDYRRKKERNRRIGAITIVAAIGAVAAVLVVRWVPEHQSQPAAPPTTSVGPIYPTTTLTVEGVTFSFRDPGFWPAGSWERHGAIGGHRGPASINKDLIPSQPAEAIIFWTGFPDGEYADPCANLLAPPVPQSAADLAAAVAAAPGTELVTGPSDVTLGGHPAKHVVLTVREDLGCDPGFFYTWQAGFQGTNWTRTDVGDTIRVWIVDVDGTLLFIEAENKTRWVDPYEKRKSVLRQLTREIEQIVESIRFD
jgi:hypothetical protein